MKPEDIVKKISKVEKRIDNLEKRMSSFEKQGSHDTNGMTDFERKIEGKIGKMGPQNLIIIALKFKSKQSKSELENCLINWGVKNTIHGWFKGGNFSER